MVGFLQRRIFESPTWRCGRVVGVLGAPRPELCSPGCLFPGSAAPSQFLQRVNLSPAWRGAGGLHSSLAAWHGLSSSVFRHELEPPLSWFLCLRGLGCWGVCQSRWLCSQVSSTVDMNVCNLHSITMLSSTFLQVCWNLYLWISPLFLLCPHRLKRFKISNSRQFSRALEARGGEMVTLPCLTGSGKSRLSLQAWEVHMKQSLPGAAWGAGPWRVWGHHESWGRALAVHVLCVC